MDNLLPYVLAWVVLAVIVIVLAFVRKNVSSQEDDTLHLGGGSEGVIERQKQIAKKLATLDLWGKILTALLAATGLVLLVLYGMQMWESSKSTGL